MNDKKPETFEGLLVQAKTFSERIEEAMQCCMVFPYDCINCDKECPYDCINCDKKCGKEGLVSAVAVERQLSLLSQKTQKLARLLENRPPDYCLGQKGIKWFKVFAGEFEGLRELLCLKEKENKKK